MSPATVIRLPLRASGFAALATLALAFARPVSASPRVLADTTTVESWVLANGLKVTARDVPGAVGVALTLAFPFGMEHDPPGSEGLTELTAQTAFLSAAEGVPERLPGEMESVRPLGWSVETGPRHTRLSEVATIAQFPGALHQLAQRLRGVTVTARSFAAAKRAVAAALDSRFKADVQAALYYRVREPATAAGLEAATRYASGKGIERLSARQIQQRLGELYVPANAVLSLAGDLSRTGVDLHRLIDGEFGTIPAGIPAAPAPEVALAPASRTDRSDRVPIPLGVVGIIAPALSDSAHPSFYMHLLLVGSALTARWGRDPLAPSRMQYGLLDDPDLARIYPVVTLSDVEANRIREEYTEGLLSLSRSTISSEDYRNLHDGVRWILGGPLPAALRSRASTDPAVALALARNAAMRQLWGGDAFWADYLRRFDEVDRPALATWGAYFASPERQVQLMLLPAGE